MIGINVKIKDSGQLNILRNVAADLTVGIHQEQAAVKHNGTDLTVGEVALLQEIGNKTAKIPARKWLRGWAVSPHAAQIVTQLRAVFTQMARTQKYVPEPMQVIAQRAQATMVGRIAGGQITPANAKITLEKKKPETRPLVETKQLMRSIHARVTGKGLLSRWRFSTK